MWLKASLTKIVNTNLIPNITIGRKEDKFYILSDSVFSNKLNPLLDTAFDTEEEAKQMLNGILDELNGNTSPQIIIPEGMLQYV